MKRRTHLTHCAETLGYSCILQRNRKTARCVMHVGASILHRLREVRCHLGGVMQRERGHSKPLLEKFAGRLEIGVGNIPDNRIQGRQMVTHVGKHMLPHWNR